ncbi:MAG: hypothetical protein GWO39_10610, partial [Gammaproteobacteria bacterium]|nr:hypothetical protein [Gammaproteobacteria bacterium]NIY32789.1 hypothetical protein [Gammaproteobacteria bacterium]
MRQERKVLRGQVDELRGTLGDLEEIKAAREAAEEQLRGANSRLAQAEQAQSTAATRLAEQEPLWTELQRA